MFIKPIKTYGKEFKCQIYKKYTILNNKIVDVKSNRTTYVMPRIVASDGSYRCTAYYTSYKEIRVDTYKTSVISYTHSTTENWIDLTKVGQSAIALTSGGLKFLVTLKKLPNDLTTNAPTISTIELCSAKISNLITEKEDGNQQFPTNLINQYELNKYYLYKTMAYMPVDDMQDTEEQYIKGNVMKSQSRVIRFDIENELEVRDIVVLDNVAYIVEDISTHTKVGMYMYKTYTATLMKLGV